MLSEMQSLDYYKVFISDASPKTIDDIYELACIHGRLDVFQYLTELGAQPKEKWYLSVVVSSGNLDLLIYYLNNHPNVDLIDALAAATLETDPVMFDYLLQRFTFDRKAIYRVIWLIFNNSNRDEYNSLLYLDERLRRLTNCLS